MPVYPKKRTIWEFEYSGRSITVDKVAFDPVGYSHYVARVPTEVADRVDWRPIQSNLEIPGAIDYGMNDVAFDTGHVDARNVDANGARLPGDTSNEGARVWAPSDVKREAKRLVDAVEDREWEVGAFWRLPGTT